MARYEASARMYGDATDISGGHPYPLLNAILLQCREKGMLSITHRQLQLMKKAEIPLRKQVKDDPPYNAPWCFFDLSTICLLTGNTTEALTVLNDGLLYANDSEAKTHLDTLRLIENQAPLLPGWKEVVDILIKHIG